MSLKKKKAGLQLVTARAVNCAVNISSISRRVKSIIFHGFLSEIKTMQTKGRFIKQKMSIFH